MIEFKDLRDYQQKIVQKVIDNDNIGLFLDMGLGKTVITLYTAHKLMSEGVIDNVLVVCPPSLQVNVWESELSKFKLDELYSIKHNKSVVSGKNTIYTLSCYQCHKLKDIEGSCLLVVDECNYFKNSQSNRFKNLIKHINKFKRRVILTGTPIGNSYMGIWSQLRLIDCKDLGVNISEYRCRYFDKIVKYNYAEYSLKRSAKRVINKIINKHCITIDRDECIDMPDVNHLIKRYNLSSKLKKTYNNILKHSTYEDLKMDDIADRIQKLNQCLSGFIYHIENGYREVIEIDTTEKLEIVNDMLYSNEHENYIIVYRFKHEAYILKEMLDKSNHPYIHYKDKNVVKKWNSKEYRVLLYNCQGSTEGLNLQYGGRSIVWFSLTYSVSNFHQLNARLIRPEQTHIVNIIIFQSVGRIDTVMYKSLNEKTDVEQALKTYMLMNNRCFS